VTWGYCGVVHSCNVEAIVGIIPHGDMMWVCAVVKENVRVVHHMMK
jgi:hypothetical protein